MDTLSIIIGVIYIIGAFAYYDKIKHRITDPLIDALFWPIIMITEFFSDSKKD